MPPPKQPFLSFGLPFIALMVLGHQALTYIGQGRYDVRDEYARQIELLFTDNRVVMPTKPVVPPPPPDDYKIVRISRPDEEDED